MLSCTDNVEKFNTLVHSSTTQERNLESSRIEEENLKSFFPELGTELKPSVRVNLANSVFRESSKFKSLGHPPIETANTQNLDYISATRPKNCNGLRRSTDRDDMMGYTNDFETTSKTTAYRNHIKIRKLKPEKLLSGKLQALKIFNEHYQ